jgi:uncharacterized protein (DUF885 family)
MTHMLITRLLLCAALCATASVAPTAGQGQQDTGSADARLRALYTEEWTWRQKELGRGADTFARVDPASQQARLAYWTKALATLDTIPFDQLSPEEKVNAQVFRASIQALANDVRFRTYEAPFNSDTFFWTDFTPRQGFATADAYRSFLARLRDVPRHFDEQMSRASRSSAAIGRSNPTSRRMPATRSSCRSRRCRRPSPLPSSRPCALRPRP